VSRTLAWEGMFNVRDLGGLPTEDGARTRFGVVIRADNVRRIRDVRTLVDHGVTRVVDLRYASEREDDPLERLPVEVVHVSLLGEWDDDYQLALEARMAEIEPTAYLEWSYLDFLERFRANFGAAVTAVADALPGTVCIHCAGGRDRTGLVSALVLRLAGVAVAEAAADYAESEERLADDHARWAAAAPDEGERARRMIFARAPAPVMAAVLGAVERRHGSTRGYLVRAGVAPATLDALRVRLREE